MRELAVLLIHLIATLAKCLRPGGVRAVAAESLLLKQQLIVLNRARERAPKPREPTLRDRDRLQQLIPTTMVMQELETPRETFILQRGLYNKPQVRVTPGVPEHLLAPPGDLPADRLGLARWLVDRRHPLTARVFVNRFWSHFFGRGLVDTPEDFGVRLIADVGWRGTSWFYPSARLSYQARDLDHAGVSGGVAMNFDW